MKYTAFALIAIGFAMMLFAAVTYLILTPPTNAQDGATAAPIFSPLYALVMAAISTVAGILLLAFGGRGFSKKTSATARPSPN